jgi:hypothetical protein
LEVQSPFPEIEQYKKEESEEKRQEEEEEKEIEVLKTEIRRRREEKRIRSSVPRSLYSAYHLNPELLPKYRCAIPL